MWGISVGKTKRVEIVVTELFDWSYTKKMQPTNFEVSHFEPYPGDEKKKGVRPVPQKFGISQQHRNEGTRTTNTP